MIRLSGFSLFDVAHRAARYSGDGRVVFSVFDQTLTLWHTDGNGQRQNQRHWVFWHLPIREPANERDRFQLAVCARYLQAVVPPCECIELEAVLDRGLRKLRIATPVSEVVLPAEDAPSEPYLGKPIAAVPCNYDEANLLEGLLEAEVGNTVVFSFDGQWIAIDGNHVSGRVKVPANDCVLDTPVRILFDVPAAEWFRAVIRSVRVYPDGFVTFERFDDDVVVKGRAL